VSTWELLLASFSGCFTAPSLALFAELVSAWVCCPTRRTVCGIIATMDPASGPPHDAYHRFLRAGAWSLSALFEVLARAVVGSLCRVGPLAVDIDDTLFNKSGRKVAGVGNFRDPIRSTGGKVVYALGLNIVVATLRVTPPWGGEPLGLPVNLRLYRKGGRSHIELAEDMICQIEGWFSGRVVVACADGAYASLARASLTAAHVVSRMQRNAAVFEAPPPRTPGQRGRPRKRGARLPNPPGLAAVARPEEWTRVTLNLRGKNVERMLLSHRVLWYGLLPEHLVLLVIVRDPQGRQPDDFFFTTDVDCAPEWVAEHYAGRWSIEDTFRNVKQHLGGQEPQSWNHQGPERAAGLSLWIYSAIWLWYLTTQGTAVTWRRRPWYPKKAVPSFVDALACLRRTLWRQRIFATSDDARLTPETAEVIIEALARAA
jgi:DDE superfamily endonuclease